MSTRKVNEIDLEVSKKLKKRRLELGFTQEQLANSIGVTFQQIQKYERGTNRISSSNLFALAKILQTDITHFFSNEGESRYCFSGSGPMCLAESQAPYETLDEEDRKKVQELISHFTRIKDSRLKESILELAKSLSDKQPG
ncbi:MAG: putative transcriptional regulator [Candidatus Midichloriaceae bacterium]|nr:putative transcriptional regulator [Candidatus Midichloriaceae bacterium]